MKARRTSSSVTFAVQPAEDSGVVAADIENLVALKIGIAVDGIYQHLRWGDQDVEGIFLAGRLLGAVQFP